MDQTEIFQAAHRIAKQLDYKCYRRCLTEGLVIVYANIRLSKQAKTALSDSQKQLIINSNGKLFIETIIDDNVANTDLVNSLKKYSYKNWKCFGGYQFMFSSELINKIK